MKKVDLVITKTFNAPVERVFEAWVDPKQVAEWYGPGGFTNTIHEFNAREGGTYRLTMHSPKGENHPLRGVFKTIDKPNKLVMTWQWENPEGMAGMGEETLVTVEFKPKGQQTEMTMTHAGFVDEQTKEMHSHGWVPSFDKLAQVLGA